MKTLVLALFAALPLAAQLRETVVVTTVEVPVTVVDRSGKAVRNLTKEQFEVLVDGKKVELTGLDTIDLSAVDALPPSTPLPTAAYRNFLLLFDLSGSSPGTLGRAQAAAREFVASQLKRRDLCAVATFSADKGTQVLTSFTSDRELLRHAIDNLVSPEPLKVADPLRLTVPKKVDVMPQKRRNAEPEILEERRDAHHETVVDANTHTGRAHEEMLRGRIAAEVRNLGVLAKMLDRLPGQKQVILLSEGFDAKLVEGRGSLTEKDTQDENLAADRGELWKVTSEERYGSSAASAQIREMATFFRRADVVLHAIDVRGLRGSIDVRDGAQSSSNEGLFLLTRPTGGNVYENATDLRRSFDELLRQQDFVYVLSFQAKRTFKAGGFRAIQVKVPAARGGRVTHRAGFYESEPEPRNELEQTLSLASILMTGTEKNEVPLTIAAAPLPEEERVPVVVEIPGEALLAGADEQVLTADLYVYAFDENNSIRDFLQQRLGVDLTKNGARLREGGLRYVSTLSLPPGRYTLRALVRVDESGRLGVTQSAVEVPQAKVAASFLLPVQSGINVAAPGRADVAVAAFGGSVPVTRPTLRGATPLAIYSAERTTGFSPSFAPPMDGLKPVLRLLDRREDRTLFELDPAGLKAGEYTLIVGGVRLPFRVE